MTEDRREIQTPYGKVRLTEEAAREANGPTLQEQKLARETYERAQCSGPCHLPQGSC